MWISDLIQGGTRQEQKKKLIMVYAIVATLFVLVAAIITLCVTSLALSSKDTNNDASVESNDEEENEYSGIPSGYIEKTFESSQLHSGNLIVVNESYPLSAASQNSHIMLQSYPDRPKTPQGSNSYTVEDKNSKGDPTAVEALNVMLGDYYDNNADDNIIVGKAYYDGIESSSVYATGLAFKLTYFVDYAKDKNLKASIYGINKYNWIYENAYRYGFVTMGAGEGDENANVFRYVGVAHATAMKQKKIDTFDNYLAYLKSGTSVSKALTVATDEGKMRIYYCAANEAAYVSENYAYTVSGNNCDGYIITVNTSVKADSSAQQTQNS